MFQHARRVLPALPLAISLVWLLLDAPGPFLREAWFVLLVWAVTLGTRTVTWGAAVFGVSLGIGLAAPGMVAIGLLLEQAGLDVSNSVAGSWLVVPVLEEATKLVPVALMAYLHRRRIRITFNPSDWLLAGCAVGAGFAMVENAQLVQGNAGVLRDMARQYGPSWLVPGAWGAAGYVGHAAATALVAAGLGLAMALTRMAAVGAAPAWSGAVALAGPAAWVTLEHALANLYVNTGTTAALILGNGRLTPWLFLAVVVVVVSLDHGRKNRVLRHSRTLRVREGMVREALMGARVPTGRPLARRLAVAGTQLRLVNATAWLTLERLYAGRMPR